MPMKFSIKELIIIHICYRDVFNAPVSIELLKKWIGVQNVNHQEFDAALTELIGEELIIKAKGFLARKTRKNIILDQQKKSELTKQIISKGHLGLTILSKIPCIKFVGISGSVAAENPTEEFGENHIDLDLFVVTAKNTLWLFALVERIFTNIVRLFRGNHFYCFNYITEESFLEVYNKNFYTATEFINLKPIIDKGVLDKLISCNQWIKKYYDINGMKSGHKSVSNTSFYSRILVPFNYLFYIIYGFLRSLKNFDLAGIKDLKTSFNPNRQFNFHRISITRGGYQEIIKKRFEELFKDNFKNYYSKDLMEELFPDEHSFEYSPISKMDTFNIEQLFKKYG